MNKICKFAIEDIKDKDGVYNEAKLVESCNNIIRPGMTEEEILSSIMQSALELTTESEPKWRYAASKIYIYKLYIEVNNNRVHKLFNDLLVILWYISKKMKSRNRLWV